MQIDINPQISVRLAEVARSRGIDPARFVENLLANTLSAEEPILNDENGNAISAKNAAAITYLDQRLKDEATDDPEEIRKEEEEFAELLHNLNRNRIDAGERPLFP